MGSGVGTPPPPALWEACPILATPRRGSLAPRLPLRLTWSLGLGLEAPCVLPVPCHMLAGLVHLLLAYMTSVVLAWGSPFMK